MCEKKSLKKGGNFLRKNRWIMALLILILSITLVLPHRVWAMDNYTHDANIFRDNVVTDPSFNGLIYNTNPYYIQIPAWNGYRQYSSTTPIVVGSKLYMYTYDDPKESSNYGHLWEVELQKPQADWIPGNAISANVKLVQNFYAPPSGANGEVNSGAGVSGPTISNGYLAIAVGEYLYWWPTGHADQIQSSPIRGNPDNSIQLIAASPLITPSLTVSGIDLLTGDTATWQTPFAVVGSWSGGVISQPLHIPDNVSYAFYHYLTTQDASNATNDIVTSSPAWNSHTTAVGSSGAAVFGVDAHQSRKNRLILMDPTSGTIKTVHEKGGSPIFYGPITSSPAIAPDGVIYVPDMGAAIYQLSANGDYWGSDISAMDQNNPTIANIAVDGENVIWVGNGYTTLNAASISSFGHSRTKMAGFNGLNSPAVVKNGTTDTVFVSSTGRAGLLVTNPLNTNSLPVAFQQSKQTWRQTWQTLGAVSPAYCSVAADVGTDSTDGTPLHYLATWTNYGYNTHGSIELWAPADYSVTANVNPNIRNSGDLTMVEAFPSPEGITQSILAHVTDGGENTFDLTLSKSWTSPEKWTQVFTAPDNYTGQPANYTVTVTATNIAGEIAKATTNFTVNPIPLPPPGNLNATLRIDAWRRNGTMNPEGTAKYGNRLVNTLTVETPPPPEGLLNAVVTGAYLTKAWVHRPEGEVNKTGVGPELILRSTANTDMKLNGLTATCEYYESWAGYPPPIPDNTVMETNFIQAPFAVHVDYKYQVPVSTEKGVIYVWKTGSYEASGNASTTLDITGSEWYIYSIAIHQAGTPVWEP